MKNISIMILVISFLFAGTAFATDATVKFTHATTSNSIIVNYTYSGPVPGDGVDQICLILDYDFSDGFYSFTPEAGSRRQIECVNPQNDSYTFTGLQPDTTYWLSALPFRWMESPPGWTWADDMILNVAGNGIAGKEIKTEGQYSFADASVTQTGLSWTESSINFEYNLAGEVIAVERVCLILDHDHSEGFYQFLPEDRDRRDIYCNSSDKREFSITGLQPNTQYWISVYPFRRNVERGGLKRLNGSGIAGKEIRTSGGAGEVGSKVGCCKHQPGGGASCETITAQACAEWGGTVMSSCQECWESVEQEQPKVSCCFSAGDKEYDCEQWTRQECVSRSGTAYNSCNECWERYEREQQSKRRQLNLPTTYQPPRDLPPAGYEDEVLVNMNAYNNPFPDTSTSDLSGKAAAELYRRAVIGGYPDGEFKGYRDVNRAEAAKFLLLARYGDIDDMRNNGRFPDVLDGQWYTKYVVTAADKGIISGHPDGTFRPANTVNTAEFLKMLSLTFGLQLNLSYSYFDVSSQDWFAPYAGIAETYDLFPGRSAYLNPSDSLTREEVAIAIYQYLQLR